VLSIPKTKAPKKGAFAFGAGERGHSLHTSTGIKTHHFTHFLGIFGLFFRNFLRFARPLIALLFRTRFRLFGYQIWTFKLQNLSA